MTILRWVAISAIVAGCGGEDERARKNELVAQAKACHGDAELSCPRPIFTVRDLKASQTYYRDKLGFHIDWEHGEPPSFGSVSRGDTAVFLCQGCRGPRGAWMMMFARDLDQLHDDLRSRGAIIEQPPTEMPWGLREMQIADPDGNIMRVAGGSHR
jgi:catechol 2,3-dioxygenase-like lactoylglutathione lyase family enzyme